MDDIKIILYILAAVAYFLFTQWRKAFKTPDDQKEMPHSPQPKRAQPHQPPRPVTSFEDILRELQPKVEKGRDVLEREMGKAKEVISPAKPAMESIQPKYKNYETTVPKELSWEKAAEAREAQKRSLSRNQPVFKAYQEREKHVSKYARMLHNPASVKDAFILSEIFNRKYN